MPLGGGFSRGSPVSPPLRFSAAPYSPHSGNIGRVVRLLASHLGEPGSIPGRVTFRFSQVEIVPGDAAGRGGGRSPRKPTNQRHRPARFPLAKNPVTRSGIEPGSPWWEAAQPPPQKVGTPIANQRLAPYSPATPAQPIRNLLRPPAANQAYGPFPELPLGQSDATTTGDPGIVAYSLGKKLDSTILRALEPRTVVHWQRHGNSSEDKLNCIHAKGDAHTTRLVAGVEGEGEGRVGGSHERRGDRPARGRPALTQGGEGDTSGWRGGWSAGGAPLEEAASSCEEQVASRAREGGAATECPQQRMSSAALGGVPTSAAAGFSLLAAASLAPHDHHEAAAIARSAADLHGLLPELNGADLAMSLSPKHTTPFSVTDILSPIEESYRKLELSAAAAAAAAAAPPSPYRSSTGGSSSSSGGGGGGGGASSPGAAAVMASPYMHVAHHQFAAAPQYCNGSELSAHYGDPRNSAAGWYGATANDPRFASTCTNYLNYSKVTAARASRRLHKQFLLLYYHLGSSFSVPYVPNGDINNYRSPSKCSFPIGYQSSPETFKSAHFTVNRLPQLLSYLHWLVVVFPHLTEPLRIPQLETSYLPDSFANSNTDENMFQPMKNAGRPCSALICILP
ncbi:hypothetical protein PR048_025183 [Dryococelus australis]|uniref:Uncharacterized protein n=1 Tax=Dryococelus australis TaxID=614101 RepID=A0ABQ9GQK2_9NEOP|nr:hypothetical protein PR048_025183 [Dryococelus australis]